MLLLRRFERNGTEMEFILIIALFIDSLESYRPCTLCISLNCETRDTLFNTSWRVSYRFVSSVSSSMRSKATIERSSFLCPTTVNHPSPEIIDPRSSLYPDPSSKTATLRKRAAKTGWISVAIFAALSADPSGPRSLGENDG